MEHRRPFHPFPNELPLAYLHSELNMMLLSLDTPWPRDAAHYSKLQSRTQQEHEAGDPRCRLARRGKARATELGEGGEFGEEDVVIRPCRRRHRWRTCWGPCSNPMISRMASHSSSSPCASGSQGRNCTGTGSESEGRGDKRGSSRLAKRSQRLS